MDLTPGFYSAAIASKPGSAAGASARCGVSSRGKPSGDPEYQADSSRTSDRIVAARSSLARSMG